jgi:hypothetical protein
VGLRHALDGQRGGRGAQGEVVGYDIRMTVRRNLT